MKNKLLCFSLLLLSGGIVFTSCAPAVSNLSAEQEYLRVINAEDYIFLQEEEDGPKDMTEQFEDYMLETHDRKVSVIYDTFDTNETLLNSLQTGKYVYDVINASDYMISRMASAGMLDKLDKTKIPNYYEYTSPYLLDVFEEITAKDNETGVEFTMDEYAAGYMWGTLGILYNPEYEVFVNRGYTKEEVIEDMNDWNTLWDDKYKGTIAIKDSMRDTYSIGVMKTFEDEFADLKKLYENGSISAEEYNDRASVVFNYGSQEDEKAQEHIDMVEESLIDLRSNIFGFEVDSGKEDIVTGKTGVNTAWSGDAVYSMDKGDSGFESADPQELYYTVPELGGNTWFDCWALQKGGDNELGQLWIDFLASPENAAQNMYYTGYTPFTGGDDIIALVRDWYDARTYEMYAWDDEADDFVYDDEGNYVYAEGYEDYTYESFTQEYMDEEGYYTIDLTYFFDGTYDPELYKDANGDLVNPGIFYSDTIGRQFSTQYPTTEQIPSLFVMRDFGENNQLILYMWEEVKSEGLPLWATILFIVQGVALVGFISYITYRNYNNKKIRKARKVAK